MKSIVLLLLLQASGLHVVDDPVDSTMDVVAYRFTIDLPDQGSKIVGAATIEARALEPLDVIRLDLDDAMTVSGVSLDTDAPLEPSRWRHESDQLQIDARVEAGTTFEVNVSYGGVPADGLRIGPNVHGRRVAFADNWPNRARYWLPTVDHPSDKAAVTWTVTAPQGWSVVTNGVLESVDTTEYDGRTVWHWSESRPIPVHTMVIGAASLVVTDLTAGAIPHELWTYAQDSAAAITGPFRRAEVILDAFAEYVGPFPYRRLAHVQSTTRFGAMENSSAIFYNERSIAGQRLSEATVAHEIAHQWFGDAVTQRDWHHLWLSEGFATYLAALFYDLIGEPDRFRVLVGDSRDDYLTSEDMAVAVLDTSVSDPRELLTANHYDKGALVLHMLRREVGDSVFRAVLREYYRRYRDSTALSGDLAAIATELAGQDLAWFFTQWLTQPGHPIFDLRWHAVSGQDSVELTVREVQPVAWGRYIVTVPVRVIGEGERVSRVRLSGGTVVRLPAPTAPREVVVDPDADVLAEFRLRHGR